MILRRAGDRKAVRPRPTQPRLGPASVRDARAGTLGPARSGRRLGPARSGRRLGPARSAGHSTVETSSVTPPVAKFARSSTTALPSGVPKAACIAASLSNQPSNMRW